MTTLWLVGQNTGGQWDRRNQEFLSVTWEFQGIFDDKDKAEAACKDECYFVAPVALNQVMPDERIEWPEAYYPKEVEKAP